MGCFVQFCVYLRFLDLSPQIILLQTKILRLRKNGRRQNLKEGGFTMRKSRITHVPSNRLCFFCVAEVVSIFSIVFFSSERYCANPSSYLQWFFTKLPPGAPHGTFLKLLASRHACPPENHKRLWFWAQNHKQRLRKTINAASSECFPFTSTPAKS